MVFPAVNFKLDAQTKPLRQQTSIREDYQRCRENTLKLMAPLSVEDHLAQSSYEASPPKWHLGHTTWFFEALFLKALQFEYQEFKPEYNYYFNSYYEHFGDRLNRAARGALIRPPLDEVLAYRTYVDEALLKLLRDRETPKDMLNTLELGIQHEEQHQELFLTDFKKALSLQVFFPIYKSGFNENKRMATKSEWLKIPAGLYEIGYSGKGFHFDNESPRHKVYLHDYAIRSELVSNGDWLEFMEAGGYQKPEYWQMDGWEWRQKEEIEKPLYWHFRDGHWFQFGLGGLQKLKPQAALSHISFYEAHAYAQWKNARLPTEAEWEIAQKHFQWGERWEWTNSAYLPYPGYREYSGPAREYNGKFMVNQMVLRGASIASPKGHSRPSYRNFFHPHFRWQFTGLRIAKNI